MTYQELSDEMVRLSALLDQAQAELLAKVREAAETEHEYRLARSSAFLSASGTVAEKEAHTDQACASKRRDRDIAEGLKVAALEQIRSARAQLSACQTLASAHKAEAELARSGP